MHFLLRLFQWVTLLFTHIAWGICIHMALDVVGWKPPSSHWMLSLWVLAPKWLLPPLVVCIWRQYVALRHWATIWECVMLRNRWRKPAHVSMDHGGALLAERVGACHRDGATRA